MFDCEKKTRESNQCKNTNIKPVQRSVVSQLLARQGEDSLGRSWAVPFQRQTMKWFKHESSALKDEKIQDLIFEYGMEGYGFYFALVELVAEKLDGKMNPEIELSYHYFRRFMRVSHQKTIKILSFLDQISLISCNLQTEKAIIKIPKLLSRIDNWTKRSVVTTEQLPIEQEEEREENKKKEEERERRRSSQEKIPTKSEIERRRKFDKEFYTPSPEVMELTKKIGRSV